MNGLTPEGQKLVEDIAKRHDVPVDAVSTLFAAIERGGGRQAQFSHPALGGMGQWSRDGMIMVGDMFNHDLKARVERLCRDLATARDGRTLFENGPGGDAWWPRDCGTPSATGSQNDMGYACFPETRRLALRRDGTVSLYDTGDHRIGGVSQQQSGGQDLTFTSQHGTVRLDDLQRIDTGSTEADPKASPELEQDAPRHVSDLTSAPPRHRHAPDDVFATIERLHELQQKGVLTDAEFAEKKKELLARI